LERLIVKVAKNVANRNQDCVSKKNSEFGIQCVDCDTEISYFQCLLCYKVTHYKIDPLKRSR